MQVIKSLEHHLSGRWLRCLSSRYIERRTATWLLRTGGRFQKGLLRQV